MWNNTIRPVTDASAFQTERTFTPDDLPEGAAYQPINNFEFGDVTIQAGDEVFWSNNDPVAHTVTAESGDDPNGDFDSGNFGPGQTFETTFNQPGQYTYFCTLHPQMKGVVTVE
ncbi:MAG: cupredoxin domain-containing protein [Actinobacteria bacterium]|nr:cupredoxin domain-containing protein [Actinomycetota bacterium]MCB9388489.1 cupredoxin domain-containing protein [Acidimicrobiia bacterium]